MEEGKEEEGRVTNVLMMNERYRVPLWFLFAEDKSNILVESSFYRAGTNAFQILPLTRKLW